MAYLVEIVYKGKEKDVERLSASICSIMRPNGSYIDTPVFKEGYPVGAEAADKKYGESVYATNVEGFGAVDAEEPFATTSFPFPVPLAQFKLAVVATEKDDKGNPKVSFDVEDYKEAFYYMEAGKALADQGFEVKVSKKA